MRYAFMGYTSMRCIGCTVVRNTWKGKYTSKKNVKCNKNSFSTIIHWYHEYFVKMRFLGLEFIFTTSDYLERNC